MLSLLPPLPPPFFLQHEDRGCMKAVWFKCPSTPDCFQTVICPGFEFPVKGDVARNGSVLP